MTARVQVSLTHSTLFFTMTAVITGVVIGICKGLDPTTTVSTRLMTLSLTFFLSNEEFKHRLNPFTLVCYSRELNCIELKGEA
jgi:hypothetical protein